MVGEQFKSFTTKKMKVNLHHRLKLMAAMKNCTMEEAFNDALEIGLGEMEKGTGLTVPVSNLEG